MYDYDTPDIPDDAIRKFYKSDCSPGAEILDTALGMGGRIEGLLVCSSCRHPAVVNILKNKWVHQ